LKESHPDEKEFEEFMKNWDEIKERAERQNIVDEISPIIKLLEAIDSIMKKK